MPCYASSYLVSAVKKALLRLDLAVVFDGDLVVGLEHGDGVIGDLSAAWCQYLLRVREDKESVRETLDQ
jgi:hypothetical protein